MSAESVQAILAGRTTMTRRVIKPQPIEVPCLGGFDGTVWVWPTNLDIATSSRSIWLEKCPYGVPGDRLWVRESWAVTDREAAWDIPAHLKIERGVEDILYRADYVACAPDPLPWKSPRFMPRWASRILLEVTDVRVERVQEISNADVSAEGFAPWGDKYIGFAELWDALNAKRSYSWASNPWVWVIAFRRIEGG